MIGEILTVGKLLLGGASALLEHGAQAKQKKANDAAATDAFNETSHALALRQEQEALAASQQVYQITQDGAMRRGALASNAAAAGVEGNSVDALDSDLISSEYNARDTVERNLVMTDQQIAQQRSAAGGQMIGRINGAQGPSDAATALNIGGSLAAFGYDWMKLQPPAQGKTV